LTPPSQPTSPTTATTATTPGRVDVTITSDPANIAAVRHATTRAVTAAGGVTTQDEVDWLASIGVDAVAGMAIYTGRLKI